MLANMKYKSGQLINPFSDQVRYSLLERLRNINFPFWIIPEQLRFEPGLIDLANILHRDAKLSYHPSNKLTTSSELFKQWSFAYSQGGVSRSPSGQVYPVMLGTQNPYTFVEAKGTSKGNTHMVHFRVQPLLSFVRFYEGKAQCEDITVSTPYLKQTQLWEETLANYPGLRGIKVCTVDSSPKLKRKLMWWDMAVSANSGGYYSLLGDSRRVCVIDETQALAVFLVFQ